MQWTSISQQSAADLAGDPLGAHPFSYIAKSFCCCPLKVEADIAAH